jgi:hypothetical protein
LPEETAAKIRMTSRASIRIALRRGNITRHALNSAMAGLAGKSPTVRDGESRQSAIHSYQRKMSVEISMNLLQASKVMAK